MFILYEVMNSILPLCLEWLSPRRLDRTILDAFGLSIDARIEQAEHEREPAEVREEIPGFHHHVASTVVMSHSSNRLPFATEWDVRR